MYDWAMNIWNMAGTEFGFSTFMWFICLYVIYQIHIELNVWRAKRIARNALRAQRHFK